MDDQTTPPADQSTPMPATDGDMTGSQTDNTLDPTMDLGGAPAPDPATPPTDAPGDAPTPEVSTDDTGVSDMPDPAPVVAEPSIDEAPTETPGADDIEENAWHAPEEAAADDAHVDETTTEETPSDTPSPTVG